MFYPEDLLAKALMVERTWFVYKVQFDLVPGNPDLSKFNPYYFNHPKL
jgi:hypothetical protein